jgi:hypothetical protein
VALADLSVRDDAGTFTSLDTIVGGGQLQSMVEPGTPLALTLIFTVSNAAKTVRLEYAPLTAPEPLAVVPFLLTKLRTERLRRPGLSRSRLPSDGWSPSLPCLAGASVQEPMRAPRVTSRRFECEDGLKMETPDVTHAVMAATSIAEELSLRVENVSVLQNSNKLALRLLPCDVFARVAHVGREVARFEVEIAQRLAETGSPVAALDPRVEPRTHEGRPRKV